MCSVCLVFFFKQKTAYEMRISDWSSDVCSSDLRLPRGVRQDGAGYLAERGRQPRLCRLPLPGAGLSRRHALGGERGHRPQGEFQPQDRRGHRAQPRREPARSEEHTSELQSLMRISYAVFCLKKKKDTL